jgi:uncharacterized protein
MQYRSESRLPLPILVVAVASAVILIAVVANASTGTPVRTSGSQELELISHLAHEGDAGAQLQLGLAYRDGRYGLEHDAKSERYWLAEAARRGNGYAADVLANSYTKGDAMNSEQAEHWWEVAAQDGNADAQTHLGQYLLSQGLDREASAWLRRAASRGDDAACTELTKLYRKALVSPADLRCGDNSVAALGERLDSTGLKTLFAVWNTVELASPGQQSASTLLQRAKKGNPIAEYQLALHFRDGAWAVKRDPKQADLWFHRAAADGNPLAISELAKTSEP